LRLLTFATFARREGASQAQQRRTQLDGLETAALKHGWARKPAMQMLFADAYKAYLSLREKAGEDPLLKDVRKRAGL